MGMTTAEFNSFMTKETEEKKRRESGNAALSPSASQPDPQASTPAPSTGRVSKAEFNSYMTQKAKADNFNTYGADYDRWINDVNAFGKNASNQTQSWKDADTASALVAQNKESAAALKTRGQGIYNFFTNYADDIDAENGAGTAKRVLDSITSAQKGIDDAQNYYNYVTQSWAAAPDAQTYGKYQEWTKNPRSSADVAKDIESANARVKGLEGEKAHYDELLRNSDAGYGTWASWGNSPDPGARALYSQNMAEREKLIGDAGAKSAELEDATKSLENLRQELKFRQDNETYEKQQKWKAGRRGVQAITVNLDTVNGNISDLEREEGRLAGVLNDLEGQKYDPAFDQAYYDRVKAQHDGITKQLDELRGVQKDLSDELSYNKYLDREDERAKWAEYANSADFAEKSQYTPTGFGKEDINYAPKLDYFSALILSGFNPAAADLLYNGSQLLNPDDADRDREVTYGLVNRDAAAFTQNFANKAPNEVLLGQIPTDGIEYYQMSPDERATYNYLYATDKTKADEYMEWLYPQLTKRQRDLETKAVHDWTQENAFNAVLGNVASVLTSPLKALTYGSQAADLIKTGKIDENAGYNRYSYLNNAVREATTENWGEVGTFAYQTGMSMADFLWNAFITGGLSGGGAVAENLSLAIMGASAAADTVIEQKDRGMDDARAFTLGTVAGLAEIVTEKVSLEALLKPDLSKGAFSYLIKNVLAEGSEEGASDLINYFADDLYDLISGQEASKWHEAVNNYIAQGYTESEAFGRALADRAGEVGLDMLGGALSGGVMAGGSIAINAYQNSEGFKNKQSGKDLADMKLTPDRYTAMVENGLEAPEGSEVRRTAEAIQAKLDAGKSVSQAEYGKLWRLTNEAIDEAIHGYNSQRGAESAPNASEGNYTPVSANAALTKADEVSTGNAALDETLRAISEAGTVTNAQARTIIADRTMLDALSEITGIDLSSVGQPTSSMTASEQRMAVKGAAIQAAETLNEQNNAALQTETVDNAAIANPAQSVVAPVVSPESSVGAATRGFADNPSPGEMVPSQNKSVTTNPFLTEDEKAEYNPAHERISTAERNRRADNMFVAYDDAGTIRNWDEVAADLMSKKAWTAEEQKAANKIFEQYRKEARRTGDYEKLNEFALAKSRIGHSEAGASLQALKEFSHNGDGLVQQSIEILDNPKIDEDIRDAETKRILDVSEKFDNAEVTNEKGEVDKAATMKNFADLVLEVAEARNNIKDRNDVRKTITWALDTVMKTGDVDFMRDLAWGSLVASIQDNIPIPASEAIKSLRRDFMLSKISTAMRNIVSNMAFDLIDGISRNISVPLDILVSKFTGTRSIAKTDIISKAKMKAQVDAFAKSFLEVAFNVSAEGAASGYGAAGNRTFRMSGGVVEQVLSRMEQYLNLAMYSTDQFQKGGIRESVQSGIDELYEKGLIKDESLREAGDIEMLYRTFQKDGKLASALKGFRDWLNNLSSGFVPGSFQLGDIVMPFVQVPANLVSAAVDYTPLGILKEAARLVVQSRKGKLTAAHQARMVQAIGRSLNGSAVIALAAIAKAIGALTVSDDGRDRDKDKTALDTQAGLSGTQLNLSALIRAFSGEDVTRQDGDLLINIGFMDPLNALLTVGSLFYDEVTDEDGYKLGDLAGKSISGTLQSVKDMPMMGAIDELYSAINNSAEEDWGARAVDAGLRYAGNQVSSFIPNALKGIAQGTDPYQRDLYSKDDVGGRALDSVLASIPGLRETLPVKQDSFGEDMDTGNWWLNFLNNNILPGRVNQYSPRQEGIKAALDATSDATGEVGFYPDRYAPKTIDGHKLTYEEKRAYKKAYGDAFKEAMSETGDVSDLTIEEVTDILTNINSYARGTAKEAVTDGYTYKPSGNSYIRGSEALDSVGIPIADYYTYYKDIGDIKKKYDTTDERKKRVIEYINEHKKLTTEQKNYLWHETAGYDSKSPWGS